MKQPETIEQKAAKIAQGRIKFLLDSGLVATLATDLIVIARLKNAKAIVENGGVVPVTSTSFLVHGSTGGDGYTVGATGCSCPHYTKKPSTVQCKHMIAVDLYKAASLALAEEYKAEAARLIQEAAELI